MISKIGQLFFNNSIEYINKELYRINFLINKKPMNFLYKLTIKGRKREIESARAILYWVWSPVYMSTLLSDNEIRGYQREVKKILG